MNKLSSKTEGLVHMPHRNSRMLLLIAQVKGVQDIVFLLLIINPKHPELNAE